MRVVPQVDNFLVFFYFVLDMLGYFHVDNTLLIQLFSAALKHAPDLLKAGSFGLDVRLAALDAEFVAALGEREEIGFHLPADHAFVRFRIHLWFLFS